MPPFPSSLVVSLLALPFVAGNEQKPLVDSDIPSSQGDNAPRIAIVGAGIAGASAAYYVHELGGLSSPSITIYERERRVGGRIKSNFSPGQQKTAYEAGAPHFFEDDWCMMDAMDAIGLSKNSLRPSDRPRTTGVWDGKKLTTPVLECNNEQIMPWKAARATWEYGLSPWKMYRAVMSNLGNWWSFSRSNESFESITKELEDVGLGGLVLDSAEAFLRNESISSVYQTELAQQCSRAYFSRNLDDLSGLASLKATAPVSPVSIAGGNEQLVKGMIALSEADLRLSSEVMTIAPGLKRRYHLTVQSTEPADSSLWLAEFDAVILAAPIQSSQLNLDVDGLFISDRLGPYVETHVTHFQTTKDLAPGYFNLPADERVPYDILTTTSAEQDPNILGITHTFVEEDRDCAVSRCDEKDEFIYRVASRRPIEDRELVQMIGGHFQKETNLAESGISWIDRQVWPHAFPQLRKGRPFVDKFEIAPGLFYLNGAEEVISSVEMSCRMGQSAAKKLS